MEHTLDLTQTHRVSQSEYVRRGSSPLVCRLLGPPNGLRFTEVIVTSLEEDFKSTNDLVSRCSDTLESLSVCYYAPSMSPLASATD
jgi:hypothetical protein